jgi:hypothetical protein
MQVRRLGATPRGHSSNIRHEYANDISNVSPVTCVGYCIYMYPCIIDPHGYLLLKAKEGRKVAR